MFAATWLGSVMCPLLAVSVSGQSLAISQRTGRILHASRPSWPGRMVVLRGGFVMTVSKTASHTTGVAGPVPNPQQARDPAVSPLRQRMIRDMELAGLRLNTQQCYLRAVVALQRHTDTRPDRLTEEQVYQYVLWLRDTKGAPKGTFQPHWYGIKFFYFRTLGVDWPLFTRKKVRQPRRSRLPQAIAWKDGRALIQAIRQPGYRLCCACMLALGLRISDALNLTVQAIDATNMIVRVIGKGDKERILPLPPALLQALRAYWPSHRNPRLLFPNRKGCAPFSERSLRRAFNDARDSLGISNTITPHSMRHYADSRIMPTRLPG